MVDIDAAGAAGGAVHGGLVGGAVERPAGQAGERHAACADCGTETVGRFCHNCGNPAHVHRTLLHLGEELLHGVMHFDGRVWRTLPLLAFRPGRLTREWSHGRRSRYVSPLAMFLFTMFVMFMGLSYLPSAPEAPVRDQISMAARVARAASEVTEAERALQEAAPEDRARLSERLAGARAELEEETAALREAQAESRGEAAERKGEERAKAAEQAALSDQLGLNTGNKTFDEKLKKKLENPELALYKLQQAFYKFSFLLVPISIPFVALLFLWKRGFTLYDHGVFVLYSLTFVAMLVMVTAVATRIGGLTAGLVWIAAPFVIPAHMFFQLKGAYGLSTFSALWRTWFLLWFCALALGLFIAAVVSLS